MQFSLNRFDEDEPLLVGVDGKKQHTVFPIPPNELNLWKMHKTQGASFWDANEIQLVKDIEDWETMTSNEKHFLKHVLAFFAGSDGIVQENLATRFQREVQSQTVRLFYGLQNAMEGVHAETYSLLIDTLIKDPEEKEQLFNAIDNFPCIGKKAQWAQRWIESGERFATRLVAFAAVEGIFFAGSFCAIYWIKRTGKMPGLCFSNELISRDELQHRDFAAALYGSLKHKLSDSTIHEIVREAVDIEKEFILEALPCKLIGMNSDLMSQYIEFTADQLCTLLGAPKIYGVAQPFDWMNMINMEGKTNFFEKRVGEYSKAGVGVDRAKMTFKTDVEDF